MILEDNIYKAVRSPKRQTGKKKKKNEGSSKLNSLSSNLKIIYIYIQKINQEVIDNL